MRFSIIGQLTSSTTPLTHFLGFFNFSFFYFDSFTVLVWHRNIGSLYTLLIQRSKTVGFGFMVQVDTEGTRNGGWRFRERKRVHGVVVISGTQMVGSGSGAIGFVFLFYVGLQLFFTLLITPKSFSSSWSQHTHLSFYLYNSLSSSPLKKGESLGGIKGRREERVGEKHTKGWGFDGVKIGGHGASILRGMLSGSRTLTLTLIRFSRSISPIYMYYCIFICTEHVLVSSDQASFPPIIASMESFSRAWSWVPRAVANGFVTFVHFWELLGVLSNGFLIFRQIDLVLAEEETGVMVKWFFSCGFWE